MPWGVRARARADAHALEKALLPESDVLEESGRPRMEVGDAQMAAQEAQAQASQGPAAVPAELSTGSGAQASSASKRDTESRELGSMGAFEMDVEGIVDGSVFFEIQACSHAYSMGKHERIALRGLPHCVV